MTDYINVEELKVSGELTGFSFADYDGKLCVSAASRAIDEYTDRRFTAAGTVSSVRYYSPLDGWSLRVDDVTSVGTVEVDYDGDGTFETTWVENTDYVLEPLNAATDGKPYEEIRVRSNGAMPMPCRERSVKVTGTFGWPDTPEQVKAATSLLATKLLKRIREAPFGVVGVGIDNIAVRVIRADPEMQILLDPLVRGQGVMVA